MTKQTSLDSLTHVMNALRYSLASYLRFARPWIGAGTQSIAQSIGHVARHHRQHATRIGKLLVDRHGHVESRVFPQAFTALNDLSIEYLLPLVIEDEKQIIQIIKASAAALNCDAEASDLLAEVLNSETRHLRILERAPGRRRAMRSGESIQAKRQASVWPVARWSLPLRTSRAGRGAAMLPQG